MHSCSEVICCKCFVLRVCVSVLQFGKRHLKSPSADSWLTGDNLNCGLSICKELCSPLVPFSRLRKIIFGVSCIVHSRVCGVVP